MAERVVHQNGGQQQNTDDQARPVAVKVGVVDALVDNGEGDGAEENTDDGTKATGQQHATDNNRDDGVENERLPAANCGRVKQDGLAHADKSGRRCGKHKEYDGHAVCGNAGIARTHRSPPMANIQLP